jgi:aspartyl-tRNA(Asn)/glutamyl-tRNA(Gln) amidotransferase subunit B
MVSLPDITSAAQARRVLQELQLLVRTLGVSTADMEKGQMRCDVNINIAFDHEGKEIRTPITEVKNVNSTRAVERAITTEAQRHYDEWMANGPIRSRTSKITAGWDEDSESVNVQRIKEGMADYRYMPEPDLPPLSVHELGDLNPDNLTLPELPNAVRQEYVAKGLLAADIELLFDDNSRLLHALKAFENGGISAKEAGKWLIQVPGAERLSTDHLTVIIAKTTEGSVSFSALKPLIPELADALERGTSLDDFFAAKGLLQDHDANVVQSAIDAVMAANPKAVADFQSGNERILGFFVGQVMKACAGKAQPAKVQEAVRHTLSQK